MTAQIKGTVPQGFTVVQSPGLFGLSGGRQYVDSSTEVVDLVIDVSGAHLQINGYMVLGDSFGITGEPTTGPTGSSAVTFPFEVNTIDGDQVGCWRFWKNQYGIVYLNWLQNGGDGSVGNAVWSDNFEVLSDTMEAPGSSASQTGIPIGYSLDLYSHDSVNRSHLVMRMGQGTTYDAIVSSADPIGPPAEVRFRGTPPGVDSIDIIHDNFQVRAEEFSRERFFPQDCYLVVRPTSQTGNMLYFGDTLLKVEYETEPMEGGIGRGKFEVAIPGPHSELYAGSILKNTAFNRMWDSSTFSGWTSETIGTHPDSDGLFPVYTGDFNYQKNSPNPYFYLSDATVGSEVFYTTTKLDKFRDYKLEFKYRRGSASSVGVVAGVKNQTRGVWWNDTSKLWESSTGYIYTSFTGAVETWNTAELYFSTKDTANQSQDTYRVYIYPFNEAGDTSFEEVAIARANLSAKRADPSYDRLMSLDSLGTVELYARDELKRTVLHPHDGRPSEYRRLYAGYITDVSPDVVDGKVAITTDGFTRFLRNRLVDKTYSGWAANAIVQDIMADLTDESDLSGVCTTGVYGLSTADPTDVIIDSISWDNRSVDSAIKDVIDRVPGQVAWGINADRAFYFVPVLNPYEIQTASEDINQTVYGLNLDANVAEWSPKLNLADVTTRVTVLGEKDDNGNRAKATVNNFRAGDRFRIRHKEITKTEITRSGDAAKAAQIILSEEAKPEISYDITVEPDVFFEVERATGVLPIMVRDGTRRGYSFGSDGLLYGENYTARGASLEFDKDLSGYVQFKPDQLPEAQPDGPWFLGVTTFMPNGMALNTTGTVVCCGDSNSGFMRMVFDSPAGDDHRLEIYRSRVGNPYQWDICWRKNFGTSSPYLTTTRWNVVHPGGNAYVAVYANGARVLPDYIRLHQGIHSADDQWTIGASYYDAPQDFFSGKIDEAMFYDREYNQYAVGAGGDALGTSRYSRQRGKNLIWWISFDEAQDPIYWKGMDRTTEATTYGTATRKATAVGTIPSFSNALVLGSGTGLKWGDGQRYGSYAIVYPYRIQRKWSSRRGWRTQMELGAPLPRIGTTMEMLEDEIDRLTESVKKL